MSSRRKRLSRRAAALLVGLAIIAAAWHRPVDRSILFKTGIDAYEQGDWATVRRCVRQLMVDENHRAHAFLLKGYEQKAWGDTRTAFETFAKANTHPETREPAYHEAAGILYEAGQYSRCILMCRQVLDWNPARTDTQRLLAAAYYDIGAMVQAVDSLRSVIALMPDDFRPYYMQAAILHDFERFDDAAESYARAAERIPRDAPARDEILTGWGECLVSLRRHEEAIQVMQSAASSPDVEAQRAVAFLALRRADEALQAAQSALSLAPLHPVAVTAASRCYERAGDIDKCVALLKKAVDEHPHNLEIHLRLAEAFAVTRQLDEALEHRQIAATITDLRKQFSHLQQALVHDDDDAGLRFEIAQIGEQLGKTEIARSWLRAAVGMDSATNEIRDYWQQFQQRHPQPQGISPRLLWEN